MKKINLLIYLIFATSLNCVASSYKDSTIDTKNLVYSINKLNINYLAFSSHIEDKISISIGSGNVSQLRDYYKNNIFLDSVASDFKALDPNGKEVVMSENLGKVTLIQFWASWCQPCNRNNSSLREIYLDFKDIGFQIIGVSLDKPDQKEQWIEAIKSNNLDWVHVSNLMFWEDPIAVEYNVKSLPQNYLLDSQGKIIAKNLNLQDLKTKLKGCLKN